MLAKHQISHQATCKVVSQPGDCRLPLNFPQGFVHGFFNLMQFWVLKTAMFNSTMVSILVIQCHENHQTISNSFIILVRTFSAVWQYSFPCLQITKSDLKPHVKWAVSLVIANDHLNLCIPAMTMYLLTSIAVLYVCALTEYGSHMPLSFISTSLPVSPSIPHDVFPSPCACFAYNHKNIWLSTSTSLVWATI